MVDIPIQLRRRLAGAAGPPALSVLGPGEPAYNDNGDELWISNGTEVRTLVSSSRQLQLTGAQIVTTGTGNAKTFDLTNFRLNGGESGAVLSTNGSGDLSWALAPPATVHTQAPITGDGSSATPIGLTIATTEQVTAGADDSAPITSLKLREQLGLDRLALTTTAQTIVPAINELVTNVEALVGGFRFVGTFAPPNTLTPSAGGPAEGLTALPAASADNEGWVAIVSASGTGTAPAPTEAMTPGDWVISTGTSWIHLDLHLPMTAATNVTLTAITGMTATNVQVAIEQLVAAGAMDLNFDGVSIVGNGTTADVYRVGRVDGGTY